MLVSRYEDQSLPKVDTLDMSRLWSMILTPLSSRRRPLAVLPACAAA